MCIYLSGNTTWFSEASSPLGAQEESNANRVVESKGSIVTLIVGSEDEIRQIVREKEPGGDLDSSSNDPLGKMRWILCRALPCPFSPDQLLGRESRVSKGY